MNLLNEIIQRKIMTKIKTIIFDLGDVIVELDFSKFFKEVIEISPINKPNTFLLLEFWRNSDIYHQGKISNDIFYRQACELLQFCDLNQGNFFEAFNSVISNVNEDVVELIRKIKNLNKYKLFLLSNINKSHWDYLLDKKFKFIQYFDELILSHEIHNTKPDPKVFQYAIEKARCKPKEIAYVDDGINNIRSASDLGIQGILFTNVEDLIKEFRALNIF